MLHQRSLSWFLVAALVVTLGACDWVGNDEAAAQSERAINDIVDRLASPHAVFDDSFAESLRDDIEALGPHQKDLLLRKISELQGAPPVAFRVATDIPVSWSWTPSGILPSHVGTTAQCGGDTDIEVVFEAVPNAYEDPYSLRLTTNSIYVWGVLAAHNFQARAYDITPWNRVSVCIATKQPVGPSVREMFAIGLWIN